MRTHVCNTLFLPRPLSALLDSLAVVALFFVIGKHVKQITRETATVHLFPVPALAAQNAAP